MKDKVGAVAIVFLIVSLLIVSSGIVFTSTKLYDYYKKGENTSTKSLFSFGGISSSSESSNSERISLEGAGSGSSKSSSKSTKEKLLGEYEEDLESFQEIEIEEKTVFFQQRKIGEAIVEKNFKVYQFDDDELVGTNINWKEDLKDYASPKITKEEAEEIAGGEVQISKLYIISEDSDIFPLEKVPENPSWVVNTVKEGNLEVIIIDSVTGEKLGNGIPPPSAFVFSGPQTFNPCAGEWDLFTDNAIYWFEKMFYNVDDGIWPSQETIQSYIQSNDTSIFYEVAHGDSFLFEGGCGESIDLDEISTYASEIETWIADYRKIPFSFLDSCDSMCSTGEGTLSNAFRKGSYEDTVTVGSCGMSGSDCFQYSLDWQSMFFAYLNGGYTVKQAFDIANQNHPACEEIMQLEGDEDLKLVSCGGYGEPYCKEGHIFQNKTCSNLDGIVFMKPYSEIVLANCGEGYCDDWGDNYCKEGNIYRKRTCYDKGCSEGTCYNEAYEEEELIQTCEYECGGAECKFPDLIVEDVIIQNQVGNQIVLAFTIKNLGEASAANVYWKIDTDSSDPDPERTIPIDLNSNEWKRAYLAWTYVESGTYNPKVIVDFDNLINEENEENNEAIIEVII